MKFRKTTFLLLSCIFIVSTALSQTAAPIRIVCQSTPVPQGPLYLLIFKKKKLYTIEKRLADSLFNPKTFKSISIEKGVKATAIYGSRAANGVVIIEIDEAHARKEYKRLKPYMAKF